MKNEKVVAHAYQELVEAKATIEELRAQIKKLEVEVKHWKVEWKIDRDAWSEASRKCEKLGYLLSDAYAEIRKQVFGSKVVFDRETVELAQKAETEVEE